jgi:hypothetical protein
MNTLNISGDYNQQKQYDAAIEVEEAARLSKIIELKTEFKQDLGNEEAIYRFFILTKNATQPLPDQYWENGLLYVEGILNNEPNNEDVAAIVIYDEDKNLDLYNEEFEEELKKYIKRHVGKPGIAIYEGNNYLDKLHFRNVVRASIIKIKSMLIPAFGTEEYEDDGVPPTQVGNGGILKPGNS